MQAWRRGEFTGRIMDRSHAAPGGSLESLHYSVGLSTYPSSPLSIRSVTRSLLGLRTWRGPRCGTGTVHSVSLCPKLPRRLTMRKQTRHHEIEFISRSLSAGLLEHICVTLHNVWEYDESRRRDQADHTGFDMARVHSMVQEVETLQAQLEATEDDDEQRALEEDITGRILWFYWCGIHSEVDHILALVANETRNRYMGVGYDYRDLNETAKIFRRTLLVGPADDIADFRRIMFDAGAGVSKHKLWLAARAAGQNGNMTGGLCRNAPATGSAIGPPTTGLDNDATGVVVPGDYTDTTCLQVV